MISYRFVYDVSGKLVNIFQNITPQLFSSVSAHTNVQHSSKASKPRRNLSGKYIKKEGEKESAMKMKWNSHNWLNPATMKFMTWKSALLFGI